MRPTDVALTTNAGKQTTVLEQLDELRDFWSRGDDARSRAKFIESYVYNRFNGRNVAMESLVTLPWGVPPVSKNKLRNGLLTWATKITKRRDTAVAYANEATPGDVAAAEIANAVLDYQRQTQDRDVLMMRAMLTAGMHGTVALYNTYDPDAGPKKEREVVMDRYGLAPMRDEVGNVVYKTVEGRGAPNLEALSIFDFITSGEQDASKGKWLLVKRWIDPDEAQSLLNATAQRLAKEKNLPDVPTLDASIEDVQPRNGFGPTRQAVEAYEMWWRPNPLGRFAEGMFAAIVSGYVVTATTFPYEHGQLPIAVIRVMDGPEDDFYGATWMEDAIPMQMGLNHSLRVLQQRAEVAGQVRLLMTRDVEQVWGETSDGIVPLDSQDAVNNSVKAVEVPNIPQDMYAMCDRYEKGIDDTSGISAVASSGDEAAQTKNARLVAYVTQIDEQKNEHTLRNLQEAELTVDAQQISMFQQFVPRQRLIRIIGEDNAISASYFSGAEIRGVDIRLEPAPGLERTRAAGAKDAEEAAAAGFLDPQSAGERRRTGLPDTLNAADARMRIQALISQAMSGAMVEPDITINPDVAVKEIKAAIAGLSQYGPRAVMPLRALLQQYMELAAQGQQQQMPQPQRAGEMPQQEMNPPPAEQAIV